MAYQNVNTPRFYIDTPSYLDSIGIEYIAEEVSNQMTLSKDLFGLNPNNPVLIGNTVSMSVKITLPDKLGNLFDTTKGYVGFLNHSISDDVFFQMLIDLLNKNDIINVEAGTGNQASKIYNKGFSIFNYNEELDTNVEMIKFRDIYHADPITFESIPFYMGCITFGSYYDMPHSPELDITMTIENDGFDSITTQGGAHLTNTRYDGAPMWERIDGTQVPPWTIGEPTAVGRRRGRRAWSMNFKYLSEKDLFASNYMSNTYTENPDGYDSADLDTDADGNEVFYYNLDNDDSFHAQVLNKIGNGQRFIFQPDNTNNNPDQFAICQLDQDSLNIKQVANGVYDISLKITEVW